MCSSEHTRAGMAAAIEMDIGRASAEETSYATGGASCLVLRVLCVVAYALASSQTDPRQYRTCIGCPAAPTLARLNDSAHASRCPFAADTHRQMHTCAWQLRHSIKPQRHASPVERTPNPISPTRTAQATIPTKSHQRSLGASHSGVTAPLSQTTPRPPTPPH